MIKLLKVVISMYHIGPCAIINLYAPNSPISLPTTHHT